MCLLLYKKRLKKPFTEQKKSRQRSSYRTSTDNRPKFGMSGLSVPTFGMSPNWQAKLRSAAGLQCISKIEPNQVHEDRK